jgi:hypothetical protein
MEKLTIDQVLAEASEIRGEDFSDLGWMVSAKEFLDEFEGCFIGEDAKKLCNTIDKLSQDINVARAKLQKRTINEVLAESSRIKREGSFSLKAISNAKTFLHQYDGFFTGEDDEKLGRAHSLMFRELDEAMFAELGPRKPRSEEDIREEEQREREAGIIII